VRRFDDEPMCVAFHPSGFELAVGFYNRIILFRVLIDELQPRSTYTVVTLLLHYRYTVVTLLVHCCYTVTTTGVRSFSEAQPNYSTRTEANLWLLPTHAV
jgi:hypothetical protein